MGNSIESMEVKVEEELDEMSDDPENIDTEASSIKVEGNTIESSGENRLIELSELSHEEVKDDVCEDNLNQVNSKSIDYCLDSKRATKLKSNVIKKKKTKLKDFKALVSNKVPKSYENKTLKTESNSCDEVIFYCDQCAYSSTVFTNLKWHIQSHHSANQFACDVCEYVACSKSFLTRHKLRVHGGQRYYCELCEYNTRRHKQSKHEGVKYSCDDCDYSATLKQSLQRHIS